MTFECFDRVDKLQSSSNIFFIICHCYAGKNNTMKLHIASSGILQKEIMLVFPLFIIDSKHISCASFCVSIRQTVLLRRILQRLIFMRLWALYLRQSLILTSYIVHYFKQTLLRMSKLSY